MPYVTLEATAARAAGVDKDANALIAFALGYKIGSKEVSDKSSDAAAAATGSHLNCSDILYPSSCCFNSTRRLLGIHRELPY